MTLDKDILKLDAPAETDYIVGAIRKWAREFKRMGTVVACSGGIDSSVVAALCVRALGAKKVFGLSLPEKESASETSSLSQALMRHLGMDYDEVNISPMLEALECYKKRDAAIQKVMPEYESDWKCKIVLPPVDTHQLYRVFFVVAEDPQGNRITRRLSSEAYLGVLAAMNFKQRVRKQQEYYHADRLNYLVAGTPNRLEYDQGFFVKLGDGASDIKPIAHLYKSQVYQLAEYLEVPETIRNRPPTTDTYSLPQSQEEFYFSVPYAVMDLCLYGLNSQIPAAEIAELTSLSSEQVEMVYADIRSKRTATHYMQMPPQILKERM